MIDTAWGAISALLSALVAGLNLGWEVADFTWDMARLSVAIGEEVGEGVAGFVWAAVTFQDAAAVFLLIAWPALCVIALWPPPRRDEFVVLTPAKE